MGAFELVPDVLAAGGRGHDGDEDFATITVGTSSGLLSGSDGFAIGGVEGHH